MRIFAFHLLNDFSGSPKVLRQLLQGWVRAGKDVHLATCPGREGFLTNLQGVKQHAIAYRFQQNKLLRLYHLVYSQLALVLHLWPKLKKTDIVYINTVLPFGGALLGWLKGCQVIYHIHETSIKPAMLKGFLFACIRLCATKVIYVSDYLAKEEGFPALPSYTLYNALEADFCTTAQAHRKPSPWQVQHILMLCSLKAYKGVWEFLKLARQFPHLQFRLVLNAEQEDIDAFFADEVIPFNLTLFPTQTNVHPHYQWAHVVCNLSRPDGWIETFGLTAIEAMAYGLPVLVPPVGGISEIVSHGIHGFKVDSRQQEQLADALNLLCNPKQYQMMHTACMRHARRFSEDRFIADNLQLLNAVNAETGKAVQILEKQQVG